MQSLAACEEEYEGAEGTLDLREGQGDKVDGELDGLEGIGDLEAGSRAAGLVEHWRDAPEDGELQYAAIRVVDREGTLLDFAEVGALDADVQQRVARPYTYQDEPWVYDEVVATAEAPDENGFIEVYRVIRKPNLDPVKYEPPAPAPAEVPDEVLELAAERGDEPLLMYGKLRKFPEWDLPLRLSPYLGAPEDVVAIEEARAKRMAERRTLLEERSATLQALVDESGGTWVTSFPATGWVAFELPASRVPELVEQQEFEKFAADALGKEELGSGNWDLGYGRRADRMDADRFIDNGYDGGQANSARHSFGRMTASVIEPGMLEDEACMFYDGAWCTGTSRLQERFECYDANSNGNLCEPISNFPDLDGSQAEGTWAAHGTKVSSVLLGDYEDDQACGQQVGDPAWISPLCHTVAWEERSSGVAPEAKLIYMGWLKENRTAAQYTDAIDDSIDRNVDVINGSWMFPTGSGDNCNIASSSIIEDELEAAFDDGITSLMCAGNNSGATATSCNVSSPSDTPKALSINPFDTDPTNCENNTLSCLLTSSGDGARGGVNVRVNGVVYTAWAAGIALIAPSKIESVTNHEGAYGDSSDGFSGCSAATPHAAGLALLVKDWLISRGSTWANSPGRLQTVLLAMADAHGSTTGTGTTTRQANRGNRWYGHGRTRLRLFENGMGFGPWDFWMTTATLFSNSSDYVVDPFGGALPAGTEIVKCAKQQHEDMSSKNDISKIDVQVRLVNCNNRSQIYDSLTATAYDYRDYVALREDDGFSLAGSCVDVVYKPVHVVSGGVTFSSFCYAAGVNDDASP